MALPFASLNMTLWIRNWEGNNFLKLPATELCVFKVAFSILYKKNCPFTFPGLQHIEILEAFSLYIVPCSMCPVLCRG